jgi:hypothetical protein
LLKASLLIALYSVRSDRLFCEMLDYNILFRWFLDMNLEERGLDQSNFSRLRERLVDSKVAVRFFDAVVNEARKLNVLSDAKKSRKRCGFSLEIVLLHQAARGVADCLLIVARTHTGPASSGAHPRSERVPRGTSHFLPSRAF